MSNPFVSCLHPSCTLWFLCPSLSVLAIHFNGLCWGVETHLALFAFLCRQKYYFSHRYVVTFFHHLRTQRASKTRGQTSGMKTANNTRNAPFVSYSIEMLHLQGVLIISSMILNTCLGTSYHTASKSFESPTIFAGSPTGVHIALVRCLHIVNRNRTHMGF
jgi:hypothetical protein